MCTCTVAPSPSPLLPREAIFAFFDEDGNGTISHAEFHRGAAALNEKLPPERQINEQTLQKFIRVMDVDGSGEVRPTDPPLSRAISPPLAARTCRAGEGGVGGAVSPLGSSCDAADDS